MSFGFPSFFWAALSLLPLAAAYLIRTRPRLQPVNAFFLWQQIFQQKATNSLFQKLRNLLSLLLVALAFIAAVFSLTRPRLDDGETPDLIIIIDNSASMQTLEGDGSRLDQAKDLAKSWVTALSGAQRAAVASVSDQITYHSNLSNHARRLDEALDGIAASDLALSPRALDELALLTAAESSSKAKVFLLTDMQSASMKIPAGIEVIAIGKPRDTGNIGITAADLHWDGPGRATLFTTVNSSFPEEREVEMEIASSGEDVRLARLFTLKVPANGQVSESIAVDDIEPGAWLLRANVSDALAIDNTAPLGLNTPQPIAVKVAADNPFFFQQAVQAFARANSLFALTEDKARFSISEGRALDTPTAMVFAPTASSPLWNELGGEISAGPPEILLQDHPLLERMDPSMLHFSGARKLSAPDGAVVILAHTDGTPLLYTVSTPQQSAVVFNFKPAETEFFLTPWFPVMVHDSAMLLTGRGERFPSAVPTGSRVAVPGTAGDGTIQYLDGTQWRDQPFRSPAEIRKVGNYRLSRDGISWNLGAGLMSPGESLAAKESPAAPDFQPAAGWPLAMWFLLAAVLFATGEEILYHRRKVG